MAIPTNLGKKAAAAALAALTLGASVTMSTTDAEARYHGRRGNNGAAIAAGIIGGLAAGALIAGAARAENGPAYYYQQPNYAYQPPSYSYEPPAVQYAPQYAPAPVYYGGHPGYYGHHPRRHRSYSETSFHYAGPVCRIRKERFFDGYGWRVQRVQVCR